MSKKVLQGFFLALVISFLNQACSYNNTNNMDATVKLTSQAYGEFEGQPITEYTLTNLHGMQIGIINYGGALTKLLHKQRTVAGGMYSLAMIP